MAGSADRIDNLHLNWGGPVKCAACDKEVGNDGQQPASNYMVGFRTPRNTEPGMKSSGPYECDQEYWICWECFLNSHRIKP